MSKVLLYITILLATLQQSQPLLASKAITIDHPFKISEDISIFDDNELEHTLDEFEGKVILLVFWATWCAPCVTNLPDLDLLQKDFRKFPFKVIALSQDFHGIGYVKKYLKTEKIKYITPYHDRQNKLFKALSVAGLPTAFLIDINSKVVVKFPDATNWADDKIRELIISFIPGVIEIPTNSSKSLLSIEPRALIKDERAENIKNKAKEPEINQGEKNAIAK